MPNYQNQNQIISQRTRNLIEKLLFGKLSLTEIAKITGISEQWLRSYVNDQYDFIPE
jgi:DNA-directed RNA polymerase specialized sigma subunit